MLHSPKSISYIGLDGQLHIVQPLSLSNRYKLTSLFRDLYSLLFDDESNLQFSFAEMYGGDAKVKAVVDAILVLHGIEPDSISMDLCTAMLLPDGGKEFGALVTLNGLGHKDVGTVSKADAEQTYYGLLAGIWRLTGSLQDAIQAFENVPAEVMLEVLDEYVKQGKQDNASPKEKAKQYAAEMSRKAQEQARKSQT